MYRLHGTSIIRVSDNVNIPMVNGNSDYEEYKQWLSAGNTPLPEVVVPVLKNSAIEALDRTDMVALRCLKAGIPFPIEWQNYTIALRSIINGTDSTSTTLPVMPTYPANT